jgi:peptidoglycan hydrolase-like protein with peptidoglycan-binding domain
MVPTSTPVIVSTPTPVYTSTTASSTNNPTLTQAQTTQGAPNATLQTELNGLLSELQTLQTEAAQQGSPIQDVAVNLSQGSTGDAVAMLQQFLIDQNKGPAAQALANVGATAYFGSLTRAALAEFQASVGVGPALGNFGAITRAYISAHY